MRKNNPIQFPTIVAGAMTGTAVITSAVSSIRFLDNAGYQFSWTGSPSGTFAIQISADHQQDEFGNVTVAGNWVPIIFTYWNAGTSAFVTAASIPASVGSPIYLDLTLLSAPWIRAQYTNSAGTGTLSAFFVAKMV